MATRSRMPLGTALLIGTAFAACCCRRSQLMLWRWCAVCWRGGTPKREGLRDYLEHL